MSDPVPPIRLVTPSDKPPSPASQAATAAAAATVAATAAATAAAAAAEAAAAATATAAAAASAAATATSPEMASREVATFEKLVATFDPAIPLNAAYLVCAGCYLTDAALAYYHQATANAPTGTFRNDTPPGLQSAKATRVWLESHLEAIKKIAASADAPKPYARGVDLKQAATLAGHELGRALEATKTAGLHFEDRYTDYFKDATEDLEAAVSFLAKKQAPAPSESSTEESSSNDTYIFGASILGGVSE